MDEKTKELVSNNIDRLLSASTSAEIQRIKEETIKLIRTSKDSPKKDD